MADEADVKAVMELLGNAAGAGGWTEERVGEDLDNGMTPNQIALAWWSYRAANTVNLVSVSESGSSRSLQDIWNHAIAMRDYFRKLVDGETEEEIPPVDPYGVGIRTFPIRRIAR